MKADDYQRDPCRCPDCVQAGVSDRMQIRDRYSGAWLHGYDLKRWWAARDQFWQQMNEFKVKTMPGTAAQTGEAE